MTPCSAPAAVEGRDSAVGLAFLNAFFEILSLVRRVLALGQADLNLDVAFFPIQPEGRKGQTLPLHGAGQSVDFRAVEEQPAGAFDLVLLMACPLIGLDRGVEEPDFTIVNFRKGALQGNKARPDRLDFSSLQFDSGLKSLEDMVITECLPVCGDLRGHETVWVWPRSRGRKAQAASASD